MSYRYIGNKTRLAPDLVAEVRSLVPSGACVADLMCGTASFSEALRTAGYKVIASDIMTFSTHHARVRLLMDSPPKFNRLGNAGYLEVQRLLQHLDPHEGNFFREYSPDGRPKDGHEPRQYFASENAAHIDAISLKIVEWKEANLISENEHSLLRHDLILAANRVANIAGTYGHFHSKWCNGSKAPLKLLPAELVWGYSTKHEVRQGAVEDIAGKIKADICYLDPPYMKRQYAANYHIIETIARGDIPEAVGVSGLRPWRDQYSNFCSKVKIRDSFRAVFSKMNCDQFLISYNEDGLLRECELLELFGEFGKVSLKKTPFKRFKSNVGGEGGTVLEYLFHLQRA